VSWTINVTVKDGVVEETTVVSTVPDGKYTVNGHQADSGSWSSLSIQSPGALANVAYKAGVSV
jgi:hypothetical protein